MAREIPDAYAGFPLGVPLGTLGIPARIPARYTRMTTDRDEMEAAFEDIVFVLAAVW